MNHWSALLECPRHHDPLATHLLERANIDELRELVRFYRLRLGEWDDRTPRTLKARTQRIVTR